MSSNETIIKFNDVSFEWQANKPILTEASFAIRKGAKLTLMGQNGAGKSTIFNLIMKDSTPDSGAINLADNITIATAKQIISRDDLQLTIREYFEKCFPKKVYDIDPKIDSVLEIVNLSIPHDRIVKSLSGGKIPPLMTIAVLLVSITAVTAGFESMKAQNGATV